jgi:hypothetical protein
VLLVEAHTRNDEFQTVPVGHRQIPPVQLLPPRQLELLQNSPAPAAVRQVLVFTGLIGHNVQACPNATRSRHVIPFYKYIIMFE